MLSSKIFQKIFKSTHLPYIVIRYGATAAIAFELLLYARLLGPQSFGNYALAVQIVGFFLLVGAGSGAGYVYVYFKDRDPEIEYVYLFGATVQYFGGALFLTLCAWIAGSHLLISSLLLILQVPYLISEPMLRVRSKFLLPSVGRASGSIANLIFTFLLVSLTSSQPLLQTQLNFSDALKIMFVSNLLGYSIYYLVLLFRKEILLDLHLLNKIFHRPYHLKTYWNVILKPSGLYTITSILFVGFTYVDRLFLESFYPKSDLSSYSLAWQIAQSVLLLLTSLGVISGVKIGEMQHSSPIEMLATINRQVFLSSIAGILSFLIALSGSWVLSITLYKDYTNLLPLTLFLAFGYLFYGVVGSVMMFLFFQRQVSTMVLAYFSMLVAALLAHLIALSYHLSYMWPIFASSLSLVLAHTWLYWRIQVSSKKLIAQFLACC